VPKQSQSRSHSSLLFAGRAFSTTFKAGWRHFFWLARFNLIVNKIGCLIELFFLQHASLEQDVVGRIAKVQLSTSADFYGQCIFWATGK